MGYYSEKLMRANLVPIEEGLIFHLDFTNPDCYSGSGTDIFDLSGNEQVLMNNNPVFNSDGKYFECLTGGFSIPFTDTDRTEIYPKLNSLTVRVYCAWQIIQGWQYIVNAGGIPGSNAEKGWRFMITTSSRLTYGVTDENGIQMNTILSSGVTDLINYKWAWLTYMIDRESNLIRIYKDNIQIQTLDISNIGSIVASSMTRNVLLFYGDSTYNFKGYVQKVKIYNKALTIEEFTE